MLDLVGVINEQFGGFDFSAHLHPLTASEKMVYWSIFFLFFHFSHTHLLFESSSICALILGISIYSLLEPTYNLKKEAFGWFILFF